MAELKTKRNAASVEQFLDEATDGQRREDCLRVLQMMKAATNAEPAMWGTSIVGFGRHQYKYDSGTKGEWFLTGFSPRKQNLTLYIMSGVERYGALLKELGKHKTGKGCLYIKSLADVDVPTLKRLIEQSLLDIAAMKK